MRNQSGKKVWLVFETLEEGGDGYCGGYGDYDNGSHSASLCGVYSSEKLAQKHAASLRCESDDESGEEPTHEHKRHGVTVVVANVDSKPKSRAIWSFDADTDLQPPCNY